MEGKSHLCDKDLNTARFWLGALGRDLMSLLEIKFVLSFRGDIRFFFVMFNFLLVLARVIVDSEISCL